jgi:hypothetical protein
MWATHLVGPHITYSTEEEVHQKTIPQNSISDTSALVVVPELILP